MESTFEAYLEHREKEELVRALSAPTPEIVDAHYALAAEYRKCLEGLRVQTPN